MATFQVLGCFSGNSPNVAGILIFETFCFGKNIEIALLVNRKVYLIELDKTYLSTILNIFSIKTRLLVGIITLVLNLKKCTYITLPIITYW